MKSTFPIGVALLLGLHVVADANIRHLPVEPLTKDDWPKLPGGAAIWFHKGGRVWLHMVVGGKAYMRIDRRLQALVRVGSSARDTWACEPMTMKIANSSAVVHIIKKGGTWSIEFSYGRQRSIVDGLACSSGS